MMMMLMIYKITKLIFTIIFITIARVIAFMSAVFVLHTLYFKPSWTTKPNSSKWALTLTVITFASSGTSN